MLRAGIVGLPNVGKSTLFNALTRTRKAEAANYPFCTIEPNVGVVTVPDARLEPLARVVKTTKIVPAAIEFVDIAGLVRGASKGEGLGNKFLQHIREVDAIVEVVRCFEEKDVVHVSGKLDPVADMETIKTELILADLETLGRAREKLEKMARGGETHAGTEAVVVSAEIESQLAELPEEEAREYLSHLGVSESGVGTLIRAVYHLLGLRTFLTAGEKQVRAWTIHAGDTSPAAAGVIHSDFEKGFIKAETVSYDDLVASGSMAGAKERGLVRQEGRDYVVQDGDVILFKFNV
jgi:ribosome-binding ATPase YchF (GTP1/OBG family)